MGKFDDEMYLYLSNKKFFADLINAGCFDGEQVVREEALEELSGRLQSEKMDMWQGSQTWTAALEKRRV